MISVGGHVFRTLKDEFFVNGSKVYRAYVNGIRVYPEGLPEKIEIIVQPTKQIYRNGELIDLTGAVVVALYEDGTRWSSEDYPNGIIPLEELTLIPNVYRYYGDKSFIVDEDGLEVPFIFPDGYYRETVTRWSNHQHTGEPYDQESSDTFEQWSRYGRIPMIQTMFGIIGPEETSVYNGQVVETHRNIRVYRAFSDESTQGYNDFSNTFTYKGLTIGWMGGAYGGLYDFKTFDEDHKIIISTSLDTNIPLVPHIAYDDMDTLKKALWHTIYDASGKYISVSWPRPEDGRVLRTVLKIYGSNI